MALKFKTEIVDGKYRLVKNPDFSGYRPPLRYKTEMVDGEIKLVRNPDFVK